MKPAITVQNLSLFVFGLILTDFLSVLILKDCRKELREVKKYLLEISQIFTEKVIFQLIGYCAEIIAKFSDMAGSRLERIGSVFSRTTGLLRSGVIKYEDRPVWYDVYRVFPPTIEPRFDRKADESDAEIPEIFYKEDIERANEEKTKREGKKLQLSKKILERIRL